ncbi:site-specific integrase [Massilia sp. NR 4-1]|uniref:site-specific integrase n=1 Tax=Massilia sp. NR 4-1 TaxID=1678028 RepID=UPI00067A8F42|nr:site-specific integrase [Massilia sp. NR 4-1]
MGAKNSGCGIELRKGARSETIRIVFQYQGKRCRESLSLPHTKSNIAYARRLQGEIVNAIERGTFDYAEFFPNSTTARLLREQQSTIVTPPRQQATTTVGNLLRDYLDIAHHNLQVSSYNCYAQVADTHLFPKWGAKPAAELTTKDLRVWIMAMSAKSKTIQLILTPLRNAIELGVNEGVLQVNPFDSLKLGKILPRAQRASKFKADPFDIDEIDTILGACTNPAERNMFLFAFTTGMRPSEYIALMWRSVRFNRHQVAVEGAFVDGELKDTAKTPSGLRNIDMRAGAHAALAAQQALYGNEDGLVFLNPRTGEQWASDKPIYRRWKRIVKAAKVRFRNPYQTRHTFASNLLMLGAIPLYVASQMGHADTTMIMRTYGKWITAGLDSGRRERLLALYAQTNPKRGDEFPRFSE